MPRSEEIKKLEKYLAQKKLKQSEQRLSILDVFAGGDKHLTADEIYREVKKKHPGIGYATIYRTLKLLVAAGLCRVVQCETGICRYEYQAESRHHDHLICTKCGMFVEVVEPEIERLQDKLFKKHGFHPERHRMELYGVCRKCNK